MTSIIKWKGIVTLTLGLSFLCPFIVWTHGADTYNLLIKLFVEEYRDRYTRAVETDSGSWSAYPIGPHYIRFEETYYKYNYSLLFPTSQSAPETEDINLTEDSVSFLVIFSPKLKPKPLLQDVSPEWFSLTGRELGLDHIKAKKIYRDPIRSFPKIRDSRPQSCLVTFTIQTSFKAGAREENVPIRLHCQHPEGANTISFEWTVPDTFPVGNRRYAAKIWKVARERYTSMPMPTHVPRIEPTPTPTPIERNNS